MAQPAYANGVTVGPTRQTMTNGKATILIADPTGTRVHVSVTGTAWAKLGSDGLLEWTGADLPLKVEPSDFDLRPHQQRSVQVTQTGPISRALVGLAFTFKPSGQNPQATGALVYGTVMGQLTLRPNAKLFQPPPAPPAQQTPFPWWIILVGIAIVVSSVSLVAGAPRKRAKSSL